MNLSELKKIFIENGCERVYVKILSANDNSKNQVYLAGNFDVLNIFPVSEIYSEDPGDWKRSRFKAWMKFSWIGDDKNINPAPKAQLILYPKYPEVRLSGFLTQCINAPSDIMTTRDPGRLLFMSVSKNGTVLAYAAGVNSEISGEFQNITADDEHRLFKILSLNKIADYKSKLLSELKRIHESGWIEAKQLKTDGSVMPCNSPFCGGATLEAELGITQNGFSEPDYLGWEIKQFKVNNFNSTNSGVVTLMTPQPTGGFYRENGAEAFIRKYGYEDKMNRPDRLNFGGIHRSGETHKNTGLTLQLDGFNSKTCKIEKASGSVVLLDESENITASWSFAHLLKLWNKKHNQACYIPSLLKKNDIRKYSYGNIVLLGEGTGFQLFLQELALGNIYYDPGIKLEYAGTDRPKVKQRSQFRIKTGKLKALYHNAAYVDIME